MAPSSGTKDASLLTNFVDEAHEEWKHQFRLQHPEAQTRLKKEVELISGDLVWINNEDDLPGSRPTGRRIELLQEMIRDMNFTMADVFSESHVFRPSMAEARGSELPDQFRRQMEEVGRCLLAMVRSGTTDVEELAAAAHTKWVELNQGLKTPAQQQLFVSYEDLDEREKEKDRILARIACRALV
ncbi:hypothetical protein FOZ61_009932 [Perkinsus olseni]|uniref:Uncharacterized protein n=1 Tax=Perkinsus olseni TaxID=32597 RepID=A0A7J6L410_PEROL|nr:hypothetical protein FOZ61_009932 [Perkinsus olseni]KAF4653967.1 hypothetical protein FOL46_008931 [Perkinsus olseni]